MAHKKGLGSSRNGRDSNPKYLGVKIVACPLPALVLLIKACRFVTTIVVTHREAVLSACGHPVDPARGCLSARSRDESPAIVTACSTTKRRSTSKGGAAATAA